VTLPPGSGQAERFAFNAPSPSQAQIPSVVPSAPAPAAALADAAPAAAPESEWPFRWTLVFTAVLFLRPQDILPPLEALHLAELSAMAGLISLLAGRLSRGQTITRLTPEFSGVLAFGAMLLLTAPFSIWVGGAIGTFQDLYLKVILVYLLAVNVLVSPKRLERLTWLLFLALGYLGFRAILDYASGSNTTGHGTRVRGSVGGMMKNPNDMALNMVVFLPLAAFMAMEANTVLKRLVAAGCTVFMIGAIVASGSRGGFLGFAVMLIVLAAFAARKRPGLVFAGVLAVMLALPMLPSSYWRRIASITDDSKDDVQSSQARKKLMGEAWDTFTEFPITGVGAGMFRNYNPPGRDEAWHEAHNVWLQVAAELGIFGFAAFLFLVVRAFASVFQSRRLLKYNRPVAPRRARGLPRTAVRAEPAAAAVTATEAEYLDGHSAAMAASLAGWLVCAFFASVAYNWTFYYLMALAPAPREILRDRLLAVAKPSAFAASRMARSATRLFRPGAAAPSKAGA
jgi:O-antigen ligase